MVVRVNLGFYEGQYIINHMNPSSTSFSCIGNPGIDRYLIHPIYIYIYIYVYLSLCVCIYIKLQSKVLLPPLVAP